MYAYDMINHKIETIKTLNIYISAYKAIIRSYMKLSLLRGSPNKYEHISPRTYARII